MTIGIGVIGTGAIGRDHARRINQVLTGGRIDRAFRRQPDGASSVKADVAPDAEIFATGEELIASDKVDAVMVTSWGATHEQYVLAAIAAGKPCFCEKPLATTAEGAKRIVDAEAAHGKRLVQVGFMRRYDAGYRLLKQVVDREIGRSLMVHAAHRNPTVPRAVHHADGDPRHADPRDRRVPLAARRRLCLGPGRLPAPHLARATRS